MAKMPIDIDQTIEHALTLRPAATLNEIRRMVPLAENLHENDLAARVQRLRHRILRKRHPQAT
jgi:hypothetical protein